MEPVRAFRSANTLRITLPRFVRYRMKIEAGDTLGIECDSKGNATLVNLSQQQREAAKRSRKR